MKGVLSVAAGGVYALLGIILLAVLWYKGIFSRVRGIPVLVLTTLFGFIFFAPMIPYQFQSLILGVASGAPPPIPALGGLIFSLILAFIFGRILCGHLCPIGAVQELASFLLPWKLKVPDRRIPQIIRFAVFLLIIAGSIFAMNLLQFAGIGAFFHLNLRSPFFVVFAVILLVSIVVYRPFCRFICPFGVLLAPLASKSRFVFTRTAACIDCHKCEHACPTDEAGPDATRAECYMCGRCMEVCPVEGALIYGRRE